MDPVELHDVIAHSRTVRVWAHGDTKDEIEMNALDGARDFFGPEARLEIIPAYQVSYLASADPGRKGEAPIMVRLVSDAS